LSSLNNAITVTNVVYPLVSSLGRAAVHQETCMTSPHSTDRAPGLRAAALVSLAVVVVWSWTMPRPASAQFGSHFGRLIVTTTEPASGSTVGGAIAVSAKVTTLGALTVAGVQFELDGQPLGVEDSSEPYSIGWNTATAANGEHRLTAVARDRLGFKYRSEPVTVNVANDQTPPSVTITSPPDERVVCCQVTVTAGAEDNVGVEGVQFFVDGTPLGAELTSPPYTVGWSAAFAPNGWHTVAASARDAAGNSSSASVTVLVENDLTPPIVTMTSPAAGATVSGIVRIAATASDNHRVATGSAFLDGVRKPPFLSGPPYVWNWDTTTAENGSHTVRVGVSDGRNTGSAEIAVTVANDTADPTPPTAMITSPANGDSVSGIVSITADASDNIVSVRFFIPVEPDSPDGVPNSGGNFLANTTPPYTATIDTRMQKNGSYTLTAEARDQAGHVTSADPVTMIVANVPDRPDVDDIPPTVMLTSPSEPTSLSGIVTMTATASDNHAVLAVVFLVDGVVITEDRTAPYEITWDTARWADGQHVVTASATDYRAHTTYTDPVIVTSANGTTVNRVEESDAAVTYAGTWLHEGSDASSGASAAKGYVPGQRATLQFNGTGVSWIGYKGPEAGTAIVYLDGHRLGEFLLHSTTPQHQVELLKRVGLAPGPHTLEIAVSSPNRLTVIDAFDVIQPGGTDAVPREGLRR
jgi:hypothetical protein